MSCAGWKNYSNNALEFPWENICRVHLTHFLISHHELNHFTIFISSQPPSPVLQRMTIAVDPAWSGVKMAVWEAARAMAWHRVCGPTPAPLWPKKTRVVPQPHRPTPHLGPTSSRSPAPQLGHWCRCILQPTRLKDLFPTHPRHHLPSWCRGQTLWQVCALGVWASDIWTSSVWLEKQE